MADETPVRVRRISAQVALAERRALEFSGTNAEFRAGLLDYIVDRLCRDAKVVAAVVGGEPVHGARGDPATRQS